MFYWVLAGFEAVWGGFLSWEGAVPSCTEFSTGLIWFWHGLIEFDWIWSGLTGFFQVETEFYRVLPSFTGFVFDTGCDWRPRARDAVTASFTPHTHRHTDTPTHRHTELRYSEKSRPFTEFYRVLSCRFRRQNWQPPSCTAAFHERSSPGNGRHFGSDGHFNERSAVFSFEFDCTNKSHRSEKKVNWIKRHGAIQARRKAGRKINSVNPVETRITHTHTHRAKLGKKK